MLFSIGNLITLVIVLFLFFLYHRLTANNRSLEKIKRLSDKLQDELDEFVATRAEELKHFGIDLDVQQKAAKIALEKLQEAQSTVAEKAEAVGAVADRFQEYDTVLAKLMDMTARVDENLARIHEDEVFAEGVNRKLELAKKSLAAIERELPLLRESFSQDAKKTIETFRDDILNELQEGLSAAATELNAAREEAVAAFAQAQTARALVGEELEKALKTAAERAGSVEDAAFAALTESLDRKLREAVGAAERQMLQLGEDTVRQVGELRAAVEDFKTSWRNEAQAMLSDMQAQLAEAEAIFARKTEETAELLQQSADKARESESALSSAAAQARQEAAEVLKETQAAETSLKASLEETKTKIEEDFAGFGQAFEDHRIRFETNFMAETSALGEDMARLGKELETLKTASYQNARQKLEGFEDELLADLSERKSDAFKRLDAWLSDMEKTLSGIAAEAGARRNDEEAQYREEFRSHMAKLRDEVHAQLDKLGKNIDAVRENVESQQAAAMKELEGMRPALKDEIRAIFDESLRAARGEGSPEKTDSPQA